MSASSLPPAPTPAKKPILSDRIYGFLKKVVTLGLPSLSTLYLALAPVWNFPKAQSVALTIAAVTTFLGGILGISTSQYNNSDEKYAGELVMEDHPNDPTKKILAAHISEQPADLASKTEVTFRVAPSVSSVSPIAEFEPVPPPIIPNPDAPEQ